jgi:ubiquinone/menaquinone biosynthesis C-methylase UbiE
MKYEKLYSGEHLKKINPNWTFRKWSYRHTFIAKMRYIEKFLSKVPKTNKILDVGCGQGLLVKEFRNKGYDIVGVDAFYENDFVEKQDIFDNNYEDDTFDLILCLDVIEHFSFDKQELLVKELTRIVKPSGKIVWSIPNMAHLSSRITFLLLGKLLRTAKIEYHPGDRPISEYYTIIASNSKIVKKKGLSATIPLLFQITQLLPQFTSWLYFLLRPFNIFANWCFNVIVISEKK